MIDFLYGVSNDRATVAFPCRPWEFQPVVPPEAQVNKEIYLKWRSDPATKHLMFYSGEPVNPAIRPNGKTNEVRRIRAIIADYDSKITESMEPAVLANAFADLRPTWMSQTFSGGRRLVWLLENPVPFDTAIAKSFYAIAARELRVAKLLPGLDKAAFGNVMQIFDCGETWFRVSDCILSVATLNAWLMEASKNAHWKTDAVIPLSVVADEVEKRYPGKWQGEFAIGVRGPVFWDDGSNPSACVLAENGVVCFSREKLFYSWAELFPALARKHQADKIGSSVTDVYWDGRGYYAKAADGQWWGHTTETVRRALMVDHGLDIGKSRGETSSEVDRALRFIEKHRRVKGAVPVIYNPNDIVYISGQRFLNIATVKPMQPHDEHQEWGVAFPFIAEFLEARFLPNERPYLLAWFKRAYTSALAGEPARCHALFLVGKQDLGKTLFSNRMVGAAMGGFADASSHIVKGEVTNKELGETGLLTIDDGEVTSDANAHRRFTETIKKICANPVWVWRAMRVDPQTIPLHAKLIITLNDDASSVQMIPDLQASIEEKITVLRFNDAPFEFKASYIQEAIIASELPFFLRWLCDMEIEPHVVGGPRYGIKNFINEDLRTRALHAGGVNDLLELISLFETRCAASETHEGEWAGTASEFQAELVNSGDDALKLLVMKFTPRTLGKRFSEASRIAGSRIKEDGRKGHSNRFRISLNEHESTKTVRVRPEPTVI